MDDDRSDRSGAEQSPDGGRDRADDGTYHASHDVYGSDPVSTTIVRRLAEIDGADVTDLGFSLYDHVDTDSLDGLFQPRADAGPPFDGHLTFVVGRYRITVHGSGDIEIDVGDETGE